MSFQDNGKREKLDTSVFYDQHGNYRTTVPRLLEATSGFPLDISLMHSRLVVSPMDLSQRERHILEVVKSTIPGKPSPADALIFGYGEPDYPTTTKVGGLPYWPKWRPWPVAEDRQPLEFLAQFNLCGSEDLVPSLPGQMLSIFVKEGGYERNDVPTAFTFWQDIDPEMQIIEAEDIPKIERPIVATPAFAVACRITEFTVTSRTLDSQLPDWWEDIAIIRGSKIGGWPRFFSDSPPRSTGTFVAALHSLRHPTGQPWAFVNHAEPLTPEQLGGIGVSGGRGCHDTVMFGDQGTMYIYIEDDGDVSVRMLCWGQEEFLTM
jgi:hypothetical protein